MSSRRHFCVLGLSLLLPLATGGLAMAAAPARDVKKPALVLVNHSDTKVTELLLQVGGGWSNNRLEAPLAPGDRAEIRTGLQRCEAKVRVLFEGGKSRTFDVDLCNDGELILGIDIPDMSGKPNAEGKDGPAIPEQKPKPLGDGEQAPRPGPKRQAPGGRQHEVYRL